MYTRKDAVCLQCIQRGASFHLLVTINHKIITGFSDSKVQSQDSFLRVVVEY